MKNLFNSIALCTIIFLSTIQTWGQTDTITILHANDTHSNLAPIGPRDANLKGTLGELLVRH